MKINNKFSKNFYLNIFISVLLLLSLILNIVFAFTRPVIKYKTDENIIFFGDSIIQGYDVNKFFPKRNVINKGVSGNKTEDLIERINKDVYEYNPSKVFILIGVNDMCHGIDKEDIILNIQTIINGIKINRSGARIYIESIYPINNKKLKDEKLEYAYDLKNSDIIDMNKKIKKLAEENQIVFVDVYDDLTDSKGDLKELYTKDGLHLNNLGYLKLTSLLKDYIEK